jgi:hypothetical protein
MLERSAPTTSIVEAGTIMARVADKLVLVNRLYPAWDIPLKRLVISMLLCYRKRLVDTSVHEHVELLHVLAYDSHLRAHGGLAYLHRDGAWVKFSGVPNEGLLEHMRVMLLALEGLCLSVGASRVIPTTEEAILQKCHELSQSLGIHWFTQLQDVATSSVAVDGEVGAGAAVNRFVIAASNIRKWSGTIQKELLHKSLFEYYGAWCSTPKHVTPGICSKDLCILLHADHMEYVVKSPQRNVYLYLDLALKDPYEEVANKRLATIIGTTFWHNIHALRATLSAICLAIRGHNIDRAFMHFGAGGAGQSTHGLALSAVVRSGVRSVVFVVRSVFHFHRTWLDVLVCTT